MTIESLLPGSSLNLRCLVPSLCALCLVFSLGSFLALSWFFLGSLLVLVLSFLFFLSL